MLTSASDILRWDEAGESASESSATVNDDSIDFPYGTRELFEEASRMGKLDEQLGITPHKIAKLYTWERLLMFCWTLMRAALNLTEAGIVVFQKLPVLAAMTHENSTLTSSRGDSTFMQSRFVRDGAAGMAITRNDFRQALEIEELYFLRRRRFIWVTSISWLELLALVFFITMWLVEVFYYRSGRFSKVNPRSLIGYLRRTADFSVLQFAMYTSPAILQQEGRAWMTQTKLWGCYCWPKKGTGESCVLNLFLGIAWICFQCLGFVAFLTKLSFEVGNIIFVSVYTWRFDQFMSFIAFINNCVGIVEVDRLARDRILLFRFAGANSKWNPRELAVCLKYERIIMEYAEACLKSKCRAIILMSTLNAKAFQFLLLAEKNQNDPDGDKIESWMIADSASDDEKELSQARLSRAGA